MARVIRRVERRTLATFGVLTVLFVGLLAVPAMAATEAADDGDSRVMFSGPVEVGEGQRSGPLVVFEGPVTVSGRVDGSVIAFEGPVTVSGEVTDSVVSFGGRVEIAEGARVGGGVASPFKPVVAPGASVEGGVSRFDFGALSSGLRGGTWIAFSLSLLALGLLLLAIAPGGLNNAFRAARVAPGATAGWGFGLLIGLPLVAVLTMIAVVGIPFGVGLLLALAPIYAVGYMIGAWLLGRALLGPDRRPIVALLTGWAIVQAAAFVPALGALVGLAALVSGLGATALATLHSRAGARERSGGAPLPSRRAPAATA